jgi:uncharacterized protein YebE (UPF0316 family)
MDDAVFFDSNLYAWLVLPLLIFLARVADVSIGTVRLIFISRGLKSLAPVVGFFEILIWLLAIGQIMKNLSNPACYVAYAGGFAMGNFVGMWIAEKLSLGVVLIRAVTQKDAKELVGYLKSADYGVTSIDGQGANGQVKVVFTIVPRREVKKVVGLIKKSNPKAFYTIEEVGFVEKGVSPPKLARSSSNLSMLFRPFRKGK